MKSAPLIAALLMGFPATAAAGFTPRRDLRLRNVQPVNKTRRAGRPS